MGADAFSSSAYLEQLTKGKEMKQEILNQMLALEKAMLLAITAKAAELPPAVRLKVFGYLHADKILQKTEYTNLETFDSDLAEVLDSYLTMRSTVRLAK